MTKKLYGQVIQEHNQKNLQTEDDIIEYRQEIEKELVKNINQTAQKAKYDTLYAGKDFYIVMLMKVEKIGQATRSFVFARRSCPTPVYKQSVWKYHRNSDSLEFLWSIPDRILYWHIYHNIAKYFADKETSQLAKFVSLMESGELLEWIKKENGEKKDAIIRIANT